MWKILGTDIPLSGSISKLHLHEEPQVFLVLWGECLERNEGDAGCSVCCLFLVLNIPLSHSNNFFPHSGLTKNKEQWEALHV